MPDNRIRMATGAAFAVCALLGTGCSASSDDHKELMASTVTIENQWASSAETGMAGMAGMAGVFGTISNKRLVAADALNQWITTIGSATFAVLPGVLTPTGYLGQTLLESRR